MSSCRKTPSALKLVGEALAPHDRSFKLPNQSVEAQHIPWQTIAYAVFSLLAAARVQCQTLPQIVRDSSAIITLSTAVANLGGSAKHLAIIDSIVLAKCTKLIAGQESSHNVRWATSGNRFRYDGGDVDQRGVISGTGGAVWVGTNKWLPLEGRVIYALRPFHLPGVLLALSLRDTTASVTVVESPSTTETHIRIQDMSTTAYPELSSQDWYFSNTTGLPQRVTYLLPTTSNSSRVVLTSVEYLDYTTLDGIVVPSRLRRLVEGGPTSTCQITFSRYNSNLSDMLFTPVLGGAR